MNRIDLDRAFPRTPDCVGEAIRLGFLRGARTAARRRRVATMLSVAAALVILLGAALFSMGRMNQPRVDLLPLSQPNATPTPAPTAGEDSVYCTEAGKYYHSAPDCSGMEGASPTTIEKAVAMGKTACPSCIESPVYYTPGGRYYHLDGHCQGMQNASAHAASEASADGKLPCPLCVGDGGLNNR